MEAPEPVCPESTIESAVQRNAPPKKVVPRVSNSNDKSTSKEESKLACESTIDSANRRGFLKKAALIGTAAAVGSTFLGSRIVPESSATSCTKGSIVHPDSHVVYCCPSGTAITGETCYGTGVYGDAKTYGDGVKGTSSSGVGVYGSSCSSYGVFGFSIKNGGVVGSSDSYYGVWGCSRTSIGVNGYSCCNVGVKGTTGSSSDCAAGTLGVVCNSSPGAYSAGVRGENEGTGGLGIGVYGSQNGSGWGVYGTTPKGIGVYGHSCCYLGVYGYSPKSTGVLGSSVCSFGVQGYSPKNVGVCGQSACSYGVRGSSSKSIGVYGHSCCQVGVVGYSPKSTGVLGESCCSVAVNGYSSKSVGVSGASAGAGGIGVEGIAANSGAIPIVARGETCQSANLQQWRNNSCTPLSVVNKSGWFGIGTCSPATTLQVNGSIGAKVATTCSSTYCVGDSCFAVLVNATAAAKTVNLPSAVKGMILYIKNTGTDFAVTIKPKSGDTIEGATSKLLKKKFGVQLIAGGNSPATWYIISYIS